MSRQRMVGFIEPVVEEELSPRGKRESTVLTEESLTNLAKEMGSEGLKLAMLLNIPTTHLVNITIEGSEEKADEAAMAKTMLLHWKKMRETAKEKDKVADLERALREAGKTEIAEVVVDRHRDGMDLTPDCFPQ